MFGWGVGFRFRNCKGVVPKCLGGGLGLGLETVRVWCQSVRAEFGFREESEGRMPLAFWIQNCF